MPVRVLFSQEGSTHSNKENRRRLSSIGAHCADRVFKDGEGGTHNVAAGFGESKYELLTRAVLQNEAQIRIRRRR